MGGKRLDPKVHNPSIRCYSTLACLGTDTSGIMGERLLRSTWVMKVRYECSGSDQCHGGYAIPGC